MTLSITAEKLAEKVKAIKVIGDTQITSLGVNSLKEAKSTDISFLGNKKYTDQLESTQANIILVGEDVTFTPKKEQAFVVCSDVNIAFSTAVEFFAPPPPTYAVGIHPTAVVDASAKIGKNVSIGPCCVISANAQIGDNSTLVAQVFVGENAIIGNDNLIYSHVSIRERCVLGNRVVIHCSSVIGSDGFGFAPSANGITKIPQVGIVQIDDDVEVGACVTIDRARFGKTWIKKMVKIDNLVQIAHNVIIGEYSMIIAQVGIAGSTELGQGVIMAGQSSCAGHLTIGAGTKLAGASAMAKGCPPNSVLLGTPAEPQREFMARLLLPGKVDKLAAKIKELEAKISELSK